MIRSFGIIVFILSLTVVPGCFFKQFVPVRTRTVEIPKPKRPKLTPITPSEMDEINPVTRRKIESTITTMGRYAFQLEAAIEIHNRYANQLNKEE